MSDEDVADDMDRDILRTQSKFLFALASLMVLLMIIAIIVSFAVLFFVAEILALVFFGLYTSTKRKLRKIDRKGSSSGQGPVSTGGIRREA